MNSSREAAREKARLLRDQHRKTQKRNRYLLQGGILVGVLAVVAIVVLLITTSVKPASAGPLNMLSGGIQIGKSFVAKQTPALAVGAEPVANVQPAGSSVVDIQIYLDYLCPICKAFEAANSAQIEEWVKSGAATVEIHPISILDRSSQGTQYSTRAANTAACVANYSPNTFWALNQALFSKQPAEGSTGLTDDELIGIVKDVGAGSVDQISTCVKDQTYSTWVTSSTNRSETVPFPNSKITDPTKAVLKGTPTVLVNGLLYEGAANDATAFTAFVLQAAGSSFNSSSTASPTPTATPTPTPTPKK